MKQIQKLAAMLTVLAAITCCIVFPAQARTVTQATLDKKLADVRRAEEPEGKWAIREKGVRFLDGDTKEPIRDQWIRWDGEVYYLNKSGYRTSGWVQYGENLYYMKPGGRMATGWLKTKTKTFYLKPNGRMARGLTEIEGSAYYFDRQTGLMQTGWVKIGKETYYFGHGGRMKSSCWVRDHKKYYYIQENGRKASPGWLILKKKRYYLDSEGARVTGILYLDNKGYYFRKNGIYDPKVKVKPEIDVNQKMVALTFDDGPGPYTDRLLNCLQANGAKATFFMVGSRVPSYRNTVKRMVSMKCELGNHSYSHPAFTTLSAASRASEVSRTKSNIYAAAGQYPTVFRLPYGDGYANSSVLSSLGLPSIYWSIDTRDWANTGNPQHTVDAVLGSVRNGSIILMHDIHYSTIVAAERIIPELKRRGYQMVTVSQLAKYKGKTTLRPGRTYFNFY